MMRPRSFLVLIVSLVLMGCAAIKRHEPSPEEIALLQQLQEVKAKWDLKQYETLVAEEGAVVCRSSDKSCNALHLLTGDACFKQSRYTCAVDHLEPGIAHAPQDVFDDFGLDRITSWLHLLEGLRFLQIQATGEAALQRANQLLTAAAQFRAFAPKHPAGPFFWGSAQLVLLRSEKASASKEESGRLCEAFNTLFRTVEQSGPPSSSIRDTTYYRQLLSDITLARETVPQCESHDS